MSEKLYRPIIKEGDHLVRSSKNPERVRGQSRDSNNKNPDIIELEEVEVEKSPSREELEYELQKSIYEEKCAKHEMTKQTWDNISAGVGLVSDALVFLSENPEVAVSLVKHGKKVINTISNAAGKAKNGIKTVFSRKKKTKEKQLVNDLGETSASQFGVLASDSQSAVYNEIMDDKDSIEREEMSIEEARTLVISILAEYISMKRNINRLSKAKIYESNMPQLDMKQVLIYMDIIIEQYPALMDEQTSCSILDILHSNSNLAENKKILEVLKIETDTEMYAYEDTIT